MSIWRCCLLARAVPSLSRGADIEWSPELTAHLAAQWQPRFAARHPATILRNRVSEQLSVAESQGELRGVTSTRLQLLSQTQPQGPCPPPGRRSASGRAACSRSVWRRRNRC